jgi:hypothetical protein
MTASLQALAALPARQASERQQYVDECRDHGHSWQEIAVALGISKAWAWQLYGPKRLKKGTK